MKVRTVYKYGTGSVIPDNAKYLCTLVETTETTLNPDRFDDKVKKTVVTENHLVWHYYEVEVEK